MYFPVAGVEVAPVWPLASAFAISLLCSTAGISGAFLLLPYQMSVLGYVQPGVSATNQIFNILACPAAVWRYWRERRLLWPLALFIALGTLPGVFIGALLRVTVLASARKFMFFVAIVLFYLAWRILRQKGRTPQKAQPLLLLGFSRSGFSFGLGHDIYQVRARGLISLSLAVGIIGGAYGVGGGAIMVPFLVAGFGLPVYAIAGASLLATFLTSLAGVSFYSLLARLAGLPWVAPDWGLGLLLGAGGIFGSYCGATLQKYLPGGFLRILILALVICMAVNYLIRTFIY